MITRTLLRQLIVFGVVGVVATCVHYLVALGTHELGGVHLYVANVLGYACAVGVSYFGHGALTFQVAPSGQTFRRFVIVSAALLFTSWGLLAVLKNVFQLPAAWSLAVVVLAIPVLSFIFNKLWVYRASAVSA